MVTCFGSRKNETNEGLTRMNLVALATTVITRHLERMPIRSIKDKLGNNRH